MKKLLLLSIFVALFSCSTDELTQDSSLDCNCDRVIEKVSFNITNPTTGVTTMYKYKTINDCTGFQREFGLTTQILSIGECK